MKQIGNRLKFKAMAAAFAAALMASGAPGTEKITVDEVANHYPWDGKVDCVTTLSGLDSTGAYKYEGAFTLSVKKDGANIRKTVTNAFASADGTYTNTFDCAELFGEGRYPNGGIAVDLVKNIGGVQLWQDGPYWAECNVGATKPEEYGYYFSWGDTNAYVRNSDDNGWVSVKDGGSSFEFTDTNSPTYDKEVAQLISEGYVDSTTNLVSSHDAATVHLGGPWRMPTDAEMKALIDNCTTEWITTNGVDGCFVKGKGDYASKGIFLPTAGHGYASYCDDTGSHGYFWSSTPHSERSNFAWGLGLFSGYFPSSYFTLGCYDRYQGRSVRPLRTK